MGESGKILITAGAVVMEAELNETETAGKIREVLPLKSFVNTWGEWRKWQTREI